MADVRRNDDEGQYEIWARRRASWASPSSGSGTTASWSSPTPRSTRTTGAKASPAQLIEAALDDVRRRGETLVAQCPAVAGYIEEHPEYADLLAG